MLLPQTFDAVAVLDSGFGQVFPYARPMRARVIEYSKLLDHPIETGQVITDYSIVMPVEIELPVIVEAAHYRDTYQQIRNLYLNKELLTVQTNASNYPNMVIAEIPHEEKPELFDALPMVIHFRQVQITPDPSTFAPADPTQADTQPLGQQSGAAVAGSAVSAPVTVGPSAVSIPEGTTVFSSVSSASGTIDGAQTMTGKQSIALQNSDNIPVTNLQTLTYEPSLSGVLQ